ncbi:unnamed protein product [Parascedosporium putredinis]|uniref:Uncharacterized protein n=1 Tax=Parascedosporium putredinis TaxID=1442378 RepID=A0A9P1M6Y1_9PEZI|nr:unnamed protein product [Parascedosporium putredinis]CAI7989354.1 unnamed protein product [Parascedosporium putredinis]
MADPPIDPLEGLHYIYPAFIFTYFMVSTIVSVCREDVIVGWLSCFMVFGIQTASLAKTEHPVWYPLCGSWIIATLFEVLLATFYFIYPHKLLSGLPSFLYVGFSSFRAVLFVALALTYFLRRDSPDSTDISDEESQPLLAEDNVNNEAQASANGQAGSQNQTSGYGATQASKVAANKQPVELPYERRLREGREKMEKRLQEDGNWFTYIKSLLIYFPLEYYSRDALITAAYRHILSLSADFHDSQSTSDTILAIRGGETISSMVDKLAFSAFPRIVDLIIAIIYLSLKFGPYEGFITISTAVCYLHVAGILVDGMKEARRDQVASYYDKNNLLQTGVEGWHTVTAFNQTGYEDSRHADAVRTYTAKTKVLYFKWFSIHALQSLVLLAGLLSGSFLAVARIQNGKATPGDFTMLLMYWSQLTGPLVFFSSLGKQVSNDLIHAERLLDMMYKKPTITTKRGARPLLYSKGEVEFDNVCFAYDNRKNIIDDLTFTAPGGQCIAFVGATGAGKSTILKLLSRLYDVTSGTIRVDGQDIREIDLERKLSGGELQRVAIARAMLKDPDLVVLDEATSAVDTDTEHKIQQSLARLCEEPETAEAELSKIHEAMRCVAKGQDSESEGSQKDEDASTSGETKCEPTEINIAMYRRPEYSRRAQSRSEPGLRRAESDEGHGAPVYNTFQGKRHLTYLISDSS